jgi:DNA-binding transcriptional regulator GbsR (MarR family)
MKTLTPVEQRFILHWGEMGTKWGINRTVAQIHALLYISPKPLHAEEISKTLAVARSNVSNSLKELQSWRIVKLVHVMGDKRDHFEALPDVWETFRIVLDERKKREIDPTLAVLHECLEKAGAGAGSESGKYTEQRLRELAGFFEVTTGWYGQICHWPASAFMKFAKFGGQIQKLLGIGK